MGGLSDIPVIASDEPASEADIRPAVQALLRELADGLARFQRTGEAHVIDLRSLPIRLEAHTLLRERLGVGEVKIEIDSLGPTSIHETAYPGIWWVIHRNRDGEIMTQQIEVTHCPAIIRSQPEDIEDALGRLQQELESADNFPTGETP